MQIKLDGWIKFHGGWLMAYTRKFITDAVRSFCLGFFVPLKNFLLFTITGETYQILTYARH